MNMIDRMRLAAQFVVSGKAATQVMSSWQDGQPAYPIANFENNVRQAYRRNEIVYACLMLKADAAASVTLRAYNKMTDKEQDEHPAVAIVRQPNPHMTEFDFYSLTMLSLELSGRAYWEKRRNRRGDVIELWPLRPDWMVPIKSASKFIDHFEFRVPGERPQPIAIEDVLDFKLADSLDLYQGIAPVTVASRAIDTDNAATDFINKFFRNGGMPTGILTTKQKLYPGAADEIRAMWSQRYGGFENWVKGPAVLDQDATYERVGSTFNEMGFDYLDQRQEIRICQVLRTPPILIGAGAGLERSTFSNAQESQEFFWRNTIIPQLKRIRDELQLDLLTSEFGGDKVEFRWDYSEVAPLKEDRNKAFERADKGIKDGFMTVNMALQEIGEESIGPSGDVFLRSLSVTAVPLKAPVPMAQPPAPATPPKPDGSNPSDQPAEDTTPPSQMPMDAVGQTPPKSAYRDLLEKLAATEDDCEDCAEKRKARRRGARAGRKKKSTPTELKLGSPDDDCDLIENEIEGAILDWMVASRDRVMTVIDSQGHLDGDALNAVLWS